MARFSERLGGSSAPEGLGKEYEMKKAMLFSYLVVLSTSGAALADPVGLSAYVDANGFIDVTALSCATSPTHIRGTLTS